MHTYTYKYMNDAHVCIYKYMNEYVFIYVEGRGGERVCVRGRGREKEERVHINSTPQT